MNTIGSLLMWVGIGAGILMAGLLTWHTLMAIARLVFAWHLPQAIDLVLERLSVATRARAPWEPALRSLRLCLPWPWPWRLERAARQLSAGLSPADLLRSGSLLPKALRAQAAQAVSQGPDTFATWCTSVRSGSGASTALIRQGSFLLSELAVVMALTYFMTIVIFPKFEQILRELHVQKPPLLMIFAWVKDYGWALAIVTVVLAATLSALGLSMLWRRKRRFAAAYLLLRGSEARLPEAALDMSATKTEKMGASPSFAELCTAYGWQADSPLALSRLVHRAEIRRQRMAAWLPSLFAALGPLLLAIPVGALIVGTMQVLLSILYQIEISS